MASQYTQEELIKLLLEQKKQLKRIPNSREMKPCFQVYSDAFGSWNNALKVAGLTPKRENNKYSKEDLIKIIQDVAEKIGKTPTVDDIDSKIGRTVFSYKFGSWNNALIEAGFEPLQIRKRKSENFKNLNEEQMITVLVGWMTQHNYTLYFTEITNSEEMPSPTFIMKKLGKNNWSKVVEIVKKNCNLPSKEQIEQLLFTNLSDEEIIQKVKNELIRLETTSQKYFMTNRSNEIPSWKYLNRRLGLSWNEFLYNLVLKYEFKPIRYEYKKISEKKIELNITKVRKNTYFVDETIASYLKENYANKFNSVLAKELNISISEVNKIAGKLRLKKSKEFFKNMGLQSVEYYKNK